MPSDEAFLLTILDCPDEDGPRLVYADWLEERGDCERAELIRLQCLGGDEGRDRELVHAHGNSWAGPLARHAYSVAFKRGFAEEITVSALTLLRHGEEMFAAAPIALVRVIGARDQIDRLVQWPLLSRVRALHLTGCMLYDEGTARLAACPHLRGLRTLRLGFNAIGDDGVEALTDSEILAGLHTLTLQGNKIGDLGAHLLATSYCLRGLRALDLSNNEIGDGGAEALAASRGLPSLERLDLSEQFKGRGAGSARPAVPDPAAPRAWVA